MHLTLYSVVPEATHEASREPETETRELLGGTEENIVFPIRGSLICPPGKSMTFHKKETEKNRVSGQTWYW